MTNSSIKYVHDTFKNAVGYNNGFNVEIGEDSISNLDICIEELRNMIKSEGKKLPVYLDVDLPSIDKYDNLEWLVKTANVVELANRLAKISTVSNTQKRMFYAIKVLGIDAISRVNVRENAFSRGGGIDTSRETPEPKYTIEFYDYGKKAVVSWHLGRAIDAYSDFAHLIDPANKDYQQYNGEDINRYNSFDRDDYDLSRNMGGELRYNEKGMIVLIKMLAERKKNKSDIKGIISENFSSLGMDEDKLDKLLNGNLLKQEEYIYEQGGFSGTAIVEHNIRVNIKQIYKKKTSKMIDGSFNKLKNKFKSNDEEKEAENFYLISKILETTDFSNANFDEMLKIIEGKVDVADKIPRTLGRIDEVGEKYEIISFLEELGISDTDKNIRTLSVVEDRIMNNNFSLSSMKTLMQKMKNVFSSFKFKEYGIDPETVIDSAIMFIAKDVENGNLDAKTFDDGEATSKVLKSIKQQLSDKFKDIKSEKDTSTIPADEIMEFVEEANCTKSEILEAVDCLLEFVLEKNKSKVKDGPLNEAVEIATSEMSSKGILDLRKKMMKGEFIGGGRY